MCSAPSSNTGIEIPFGVCGMCVSSVRKPSLSGSKSRSTLGGREVILNTHKRVVTPTFMHATAGSHTLTNIQ